MASMRRRWLEVAVYLTSNRALSSRCFDEIRRQYATPRRYYHTLHGHIRSCIEDLCRESGASGFVRRNAILELALWFHDAVYDPRRTDNEERSAQFARRILRRLKAPEATIRDVERLILLTKHRVAPRDFLGGQLVDFDMAILAASPSRYRRYRMGIRQEYSWVSENEYCEHRIRFLEMLLRRKYIFRTLFFRATRDRQARANIRREIKYLQRILAHSKE